MMLAKMLVSRDVIWSFCESTYWVLAKVVHVLGNNKDAVSAIESVAKVLALGVAAWWTWQTYVKKRLQFPSAKLEHVISNWEDGEMKFLRVTLRMTNTGNVLIRIAEGCTWIQQLTPLSMEIQDAIRAGKDPVTENTTEFGWPVLKERTMRVTASKEQFEIEPAEIEEFPFDFVIEGDVSRVLVYSYVENQTKKIGWNLNTVYEIPKAKTKLGKWLRNL